MICKIQNLLRFEIEIVRQKSMSYLSLIEKDVEQYVTRLFSNSTIHYPYHNFSHTENVVEYVKLLTAFYKLDDRENFIAVIAGWFHDVGHVTGVLTGHEEVSVFMMQEYFSLRIIDSSIVAQIAECVRATKLPAKPSGLLQMIICDADTWHIGTDDFRKTDDLVRTEMELRLNKKFDFWVEDTITFLKLHTFFTSYCKNTLQKGKEENIAWLQSRLQQTN